MLETLLVTISPYLGDYRKSCVKNILILCLCILDQETVCLNRLKKHVGKLTGKSGVAPNSHYKRLIRIFDYYAFSRLWLDLLLCAFCLFRLQSDYLLLDGTSWKRGEKWYHFLTLCMVYRGVGIPIYWVDLNKHGLSNCKERKALIKKAMKYFNLKDKTLLADREYIGIVWFKYLICNEINFIIRLKHKTYKAAIDQAEGKSYEALKAKVLRSKKPYKAVTKTFVLEGMTLAFVVAKHPKADPKEPMIFLLTNRIEDHPCSVAQTYLIRWKIEHCFRQLKSNGFQLEQINLKGKSRTRLLMAVIVFAYALSIHEGLKTYQKVPIKRYKDGTTAKAESVFRVGINKMANIATSLSQFIRYLETQLSLACNAYRSPKAIFV